MKEGAVGAGGVPGGVARRESVQRALWQVPCSQYVMIEADINLWGVLSGARYAANPKYS